MNYYKEIKNELINNEVYKRVKDYSKNKNELSTYYNVGKLLIEAQGGEDKAKYGNALIKEYSEKLTNEIGRGYTFSALSRMRQFYLLSEKIATLSQQLTWSHYCELLVFDNVDEINYYIKQTEIYNLSVRELREKIKSKEYQRLDDNTKLKLINKEETVVSDFIKNPIVIRNKYNIDKESITEKILQRLILEDIPSFLKELGNRYSVTTLKYMRMFYLLIEKGQPLADQLTWFYYCELLFIKYNIYYF